MPYGKTDVFVNIPDDRLIDIIKIPSPTRLIDLREGLKNSAENPIGSERLSDLIKPAKNIVVAVQKPHCSTLLMDLVEALNGLLGSWGVKSDDIRVIFSGDVAQPHRKQGSDTLNAGSSHSYTASELVTLGNFEGHEVKINKVFMQADLKIAIGVFEPHYLTGYWGAPHTVAPGLLDLKMLEMLYKDALNKDYKDILTPDTSFEEVFRACDAAGLNFTINLFAERSGIIDIFSGDYKSAFREALKKYNERYRQKVNGHIDVVVAGVGGAPYDSTLPNLYQAVSNALKVIDQQGCVILASECENWLASKNLLDTLIKLRGGSASSGWSTGYLPEFPLAYLFMKAIEYADISIVSIMPHYYSKKALKFRPYRTLNHALQTAINRVNKQAKVLAVQDIYHTTFTRT
ncbi:DUF2088 domain-containing protein [Candidatus Bathyarchaeota archaeon]|nr:DUF2088 domain-containing protein [Candidatus Bathyarchaeota archaeon]